MKKLELHLHLEGAAPPDLVRDLAARKSEDIGRIFDERGNYAYRGFDEFLKVYEAATSVIRGPEDYARLLEVVLQNCAENGVIYAELFVSPEFCGGGDLAAWHEHLHAMTEMAAKMRGQGIDSRAILTSIRHFGPERSKATAICAAETAGGWVTGFGMGGAEGVGRATDYAWSFDCAREAGLGLTCHAGEWGGPDSIRDALSLGCTRIGHGVRAIEDNALVDRLAEDEITLEVCPGSNIALGVYPRLRDHPIAKLIERGVRVTVSTDDPPFFHTTMRQEYEALARVFDFAEPEFDRIAHWAIDAAFCDDDTRARLRKELS